jgi:hypothetical protein
MDLTYSIQDLNQLQLQVLRSIKYLESNGTIIGEQHSLSIIRNLIEENKQLRDELVRKYWTEEK